MNKQRLIIRISRDGIMLSTTEEKTVKFERYPLNSGIALAANMREALQTVTMLKDEYNKVVVTVDSPVLTIPVSMFNEEEQVKLYQHAYSSW